MVILAATVLFVGLLAAKPQKSTPIVGKWRPIQALVNGQADPYSTLDKVQEFKVDQTYDAKTKGTDGMEQVLHKGKYLMADDTTMVTIRFTPDGKLTNLANVYNVKIKNDTLHLYGYAVKSPDGRTLAAFFLDEFWVRLAEE